MLCRYKNIAIKRSSTIEAVQNGEDIVFHVDFPQANVLPEITGILFNDKLYCSATHSQEPGALTTLNAMHYFSTPIISKGSITKPDIQDLEQVEAANSPPQHTSTNRVTVPNNTHSILSSIDFESSSKPYASTKVIEKLPSTSAVSIANKFFMEIRCGKTEDTQALVVHGSPTSENQHPWLIAMFHLQESTAEYKFKCAANLVSSKHAITAAHCVRTHKSIEIPKDNIILVLGKHNIRAWAVRSEIRNVQELHIPPDYVQPSDADVAVIVMSKTIEFTSTIQPVCLWEEDSSLDVIAGSNGTVIGWGKDEFGNDYVAEPKQLNMPVASQEDCLRSDARFFKITSTRTFCAGSRKGEGVCTGDSGGGLIIKRRGRWTLRGIVSSALIDSSTRSCDVNNYMVFSDVAKFMPWIHRIMAK